MYKYVCTILVVMFFLTFNLTNRSLAESPTSLTTEGVKRSMQLNIGVGISQHTITTPDGTFWQEPFPHSWDTNNFGFKAGLEYNLSDSWAINTGYINLGTTKGKALATASDLDYDLNTAQCVANCGTPTAWNTKDRLQGVELYLTFKHSIWSLEPFVTLGGAILWHQLTATYQSHPYNKAERSMEFDGRILAGRVGTGVCYQYLCADTTYYHGLTGQDESHFPLAQRAFLSTIFLAIPLF